MTAVIGFFRRWGWLLLFIIAAAVVLVVTMGRVRPNVKTEIDVAKADAKAEKLAAELGHREAVAKIEEEHAHQIAALEAAQKVEAEKLKSNPVALSRFLVRAAATNRGTK